LTEEVLSRRADELKDLLEKYDYKGYDPFDILNSPFLSSVSRNYYFNLVINKFGSRVASDNLRKLLRVPLIEDPKIYTCSYFAYKLLEDKDPYNSKLMINRLVGLTKQSNYGTYWGYDYTWPTIYDGTNRKGNSTLVPSSFAMFALSYDFTLTQNNKLLNILDSTLAYFIKEHYCFNDRGYFLGYFSHSKVNTHNANLLGCAALSIASVITGTNTHLNKISKCALTSLKLIDRNGFLSYNDHSRGNWTDAYHHLYIIGSLYIIKSFNDKVDKELYEEKILQLSEYYRDNFLLKGNLLNYFPNTFYPIDCHNYAAAIIFSVLFQNKIFADSIDIYQLFLNIDKITWNKKKKRYLHKVHKMRKDKRFFLRWNQSWMFLAIAVLMKKDKIMDTFH